MKKDIFNGNIKHEYTAFIWTSMIVIALIFIGCGSIFLYLALGSEPGVINRVFWIVSVLAYAYGVLHTILTVFVIRKYPRYPKLRRLCLNSDSYFVGEDTHDFHGHWRSWLRRPAFEAGAHIAEQNKGLEAIRYPRRYRVYTVLCIIGIVFLFFNLVVAYIALENIAALPKVLQNEGVVFGAFIIAELFDVVLSAAFAFRAKKIRGMTIEEHRKKRQEKGE